MGWLDRLRRDPERILRNVPGPQVGDQGGACIGTHTDYREWKENWADGLSDEDVAFGLANEAREAYVFRTLRCEAAQTEQDALPLRMEFLARIKEMMREGWEVNCKGVAGAHPLHAHIGPALPGLWVEMKRLKTEKELVG